MHFESVDSLVLDIFVTLSIKEMRKEESAKVWVSFTTSSSDHILPAFGCSVADTPPSSADEPLQRARNPFGAFGAANF